MTANSHPPKRFIADAMLGKLAKWLRILGCDVEYYPDIADEEIVEKAYLSNRILLTRDTLLIKRKKARDNHFFIHSDSYRDQLRQVVEHFSIDSYKHILKRCLLCNTKLTPVDKISIRAEVPPYVYETQDHYATCPSCHRIYWGATHKDKMIREMENILHRSGKDKDAN